MADLFAAAYNPDVLSCLANLSNDEVFTPPDLANQVLDMLPEEIWRDSSATFLDPCCKTGVFLREIAKRLIEGLSDEIPDLQERLDHIYHKQLFGVAITELTGLLSRRSLYCSKYPNGKYSVSRFDTEAGGIRFHECKHKWVGGRCVFCGASEKEMGEGREGLETHAYEFIHLDNPEELFDMKFDVIVGNPPYQLNDGGNGASASPIYHLFVQQAKRLHPRFLVMITPSRYLAGGKGLDSFREEMLADKHILKMVDYINAKDCFPQNSVGGGVNYFLWDRDHEGKCEFTTVVAGTRDTRIRYLNEFPVFVRRNQAVDIIHKVRARGFESVSDMVTSRNPFDLPTSTRGAEKSKSGYLAMTSSKGISYIPREQVTKGFDYIDSYKVLVSRITYEHAGEPDKDGKVRVLSKIEVLKPGEVCTDSYLLIGPFSKLDEAENCRTFLSTKFVRFLISQTLTSINLSKDKFFFVPKISFSTKVNDAELFEMFGLDGAEQEFISELMHEMPVAGDSDA